jgi:hypothetical protein
MPLTMTKNSSLRVSLARKGRIVSGASVWPMNTEAPTDSDSAPLVPIVRTMTHASTPTIFCITPR